MTDVLRSIYMIEYMGALISMYGWFQTYEEAEAWIEYWVVDENSRIHYTPVCFPQNDGVVLPTGPRTAAAKYRGPMR